MNALISSVLSNLKKYTAWKVSKYEVISGPYFQYSIWIRRDTEYLFVLSSNTGKYGLELTPYLDTFHAVISIRVIRVLRIQKKASYSRLTHFTTMFPSYRNQITFSAMRLISVWWVQGHSFNTYAKFSEELTFLTTWYAHVRMRIRG